MYISTDTHIPFLHSLQWSQMCPLTQTTEHSSSSSPPLPHRSSSPSSTPPGGQDSAPQCCPRHKHGTHDGKNLAPNKVHCHATHTIHTSSNFLASWRRFRQYLIQHLAISALCCLSFSLRSLSISPGSGSGTEGCETTKKVEKG